MGFISILLNSSVLMYVIAFVCAVLCIRCLFYGIMGGTSALLRILFTLLFACLTYYFYRHAGLLHGPNAIDNFIFDTWGELKNLVIFIKQKLF